MKLIYHTNYDSSYSRGCYKKCLNTATGSTHASKGAALIRSRGRQRDSTRAQARSAYSLRTLARVLRNEYLGNRGD
jgi:hypothetical protein